MANTEEKTVEIPTRSSIDDNLTVDTQLHIWNLLRERISRHWRQGAATSQLATHDGGELRCWHLARRGQPEPDRDVRARRPAYFSVVLHGDTGRPPAGLGSVRILTRMYLPTLSRTRLDRTSERHMPVARPLQDWPSSQAVRQGRASPGQYVYGTSTI